ncbi:MAG: cation:proton antiporter [Alistipes sp.]|nr:cation:proton antiporter [Rikenellaceae bacterium]MBQ6881468.1 cation:proton antiporter [Alistipes sp.]MBR1993959.1 cation:proton antiporter [Alistipes sp.]MBR3847208.1 cation:proton antiporter [Alistipes sp.]
MTLLALHTAFTLPIQDPILKFLIIMTIVLGTPLILNKLKIPYLLGLIIAGAVIGEHGLNLVARDSSIILSGTAGMLYILFLAGLEMDMADFKRNSLRSLTFGLYTFIVPMAFGVVAGYYLLGYSLLSSLLLAALFASQTLIAYPIISKLGITRDKAVTIAVGGTIIVDILALVTLTVVVGFATGSTESDFWWQLAASVAACGVVILWIFPLIGRWFFKRCSDNISQYVFVLVSLFLGAYLTQLAGLEPIIGAFLAGLAMNRLIPRTSPLMNRVEFVGNAIFIPFFLIGVGMLVDYHAIFGSWETLLVGGVMVVMVTASKYIAALLTAKTFRLTGDQQTVLFGLSVAHVAGTLAVVMVGYNITIGTTPEGLPIRLLDEAVLNGTILMILVTCTISSFTTQRGAHQIALNGPQNDRKVEVGEHVLIPVSHPRAVAEAVGLGIAVTKQKHRSLYALNAIDNQNGSTEAVESAEKMLSAAADAAAAAGIHLHRLMRYDVNIANAIVSTVRERNITDLVLGMHVETAHISPFNALVGQTVLGSTIPRVLSRSNVTTYIYSTIQPLSTIKRHLVFVPRRAELELGFETWVLRIRHLAHDTGAKLIFYATQATIDQLRRKPRKVDIADYVVSESPWEDPEQLFAPVEADDAVWVIMSRRERISYTAAMNRIPAYVEEHFTHNNHILLYPVQAGTESELLKTM